MALEFRILGTLEVALDGELLPLAGRLRRSLVGLLVLHARETVSSDQLIEHLWPGHDPGARARLQVYMSQLRKLLRPYAGVLETRPGGYALCVDPDDVDALRFERLVAVGREALAAEEPGRAREALVEGLALWRGQALADLAYESFAQLAAGRLEELRVVALEDRIDADLQLGRQVELVPELERLVSEHPLRERLRGHLMLALYRSGRQADALAAFRNTRRVLDEELGLEPGPELKELQAAILRHDAALRIEPPELRERRHLPAPPTPLVGRGGEVDEISALLREGSVRLVTMTGAGGSGKTRLALQVAHDLADAFEDGVYFVDLAHLRDPALVPSQVAHALGLGETGDRSTTESVQEHLRTRRLLLLLDNFEVVDEAAPLLAQLLAAAPELALLVTSRAPLRLSAEHEYRVPTLSPVEAARLFVIRARAVAPGFRRPSEESADVAELCRRLDCLPLGIELAAARTRELAAEELLTALPGTLELASGGGRDLPPRQQTLRATIDWSYELLAPEERQSFARLAVFAGGCTALAAAAVCGVDRERLAALVAKSLLRERLGRTGEPRYVMLETVREYALERLEASGEDRDVRERHLAHFLELAERSEQEVVGGSRLGPWLDRLATEHDNLRAALTCSRDTGCLDSELRLVAALARFWTVRGHLREGRGHLENALGRPDDQPAELRARALAGASQLALRLGDYARLTELARENLSLCETLGDREGEARALDRLATAACNDGDFARGMSLYERSEALFRELGDERGSAVTLTNMGNLALMEGDYERAVALSQEGLALHQRLGAQDAMLQPLFNLGLAFVLQDRHSDALPLLRKGLELADRLGYAEALIYFLEGLAATHVATGDPTKAAMVLGAVESAMAATGVSLEPLERELHERTAREAMSALPSETAGSLFEAGRALELRDAVELVLETADRAEVSSTSSS